jgi:hypothetical protein
MHGWGGGEGWEKVGVGGGMGKGGGGKVRQEKGT